MKFLPHLPPELPPNQARPAITTLGGLLATRSIALMVHRTVTNAFAA